MSTITLPALIDMHVHLRDPNQTHKEDFYSGTSAALAGGFTTIIDMPNNAAPITSLERLEEKIAIARDKTVCDIGFYFGSLGDNLNEFEKVQDKVMGLKLYLDMTTGGFIIDEAAVDSIYDAWRSEKPILLHSEEDNVAMVVKAVRRTGQKSHFCHVSSAHELSQVILAKKEGLPVTCGVCPHHLFLTEEDAAKWGPYAQMKPILKTRDDVAFLWENLAYVDVIESDHAPHTKEEKDSETPPFGVPGLETTLPLLMTAADEGRLTLEDIKRLCYGGPRQVLGLSEQENTHIEVTEGEYVIKNANLKTKCGWSPFDGWKVSACVKAVVIRGEKVYDEGQILVKPGSGYILS